MSRKAHWRPVVPLTAILEPQYPPHCGYSEIWESLLHVTPSSNLSPLTVKSQFFITAYKPFYDLATACVSTGIYHGTLCPSCSSPLFPSVRNLAFLFPYVKWSISMLQMAQILLIPWDLPWHCIQRLSSAHWLFPVCSMVIYFWCVALREYEAIIYFISFLCPAE